MVPWWSGLSSLNQVFFVVAVFFSTIFVWQLASSVSGLTGAESDAEADGGDMDMDGDVLADADGADDFVDDAPGLVTFRLLSIRSIIAFGTLFSWAGALYMQQDITQLGALVRAFAWGLLGMICVGLFFWMLPRLSEEGTASLDTALGQTGPVYMNIPANGVGQVRLVVSGRVQFVKARSSSGDPLPAGAMVRATRRLDAATVEVEAIDSRGAI